MLGWTADACGECCHPGLSPNVAQPPCSHALPIPPPLQGVVKEPHFRRFRSETAQSEGGARKMLQDAGVGHYWELCEAFTTE